MLAARDQENLVHAHQPNAGGKQSDLGARALQPKTPGNIVPRTPFRTARNDENIPIAFNGQHTARKGPWKGNEKTQQTNKGVGTLDKNACVTPLGTISPAGVSSINADEMIQDHACVRHWA